MINDNNGNGHETLDDLAELDPFSSTSQKVYVKEESREWHDSIKLYLRDIGKYVILTRREELAVGYAINNNYLKIDELHNSLEKLIFKMKDGASKDDLFDMLARLYSYDEIKSFRKKKRKSAGITELLQHYDKIKSSDNDSDKDFTGIPRRCREYKAVRDYFKKVYMAADKKSEETKEEFNEPWEDIDKTLFVPHRNSGKTIGDILYQMLHHYAQAEFWKKELICSNMKLVPRLAKTYTNKGLSALDMINEGNIGLIRAAEKYDIIRGFKFSTYATWWIRQCMLRAIANKSRLIRFPAHSHSDVIRVRNVTERFYNQYGREPSSKELAKLTKLSLSAVNKSKFLLATQEHVISLDKELDEGMGGDSSLINAIPDSNSKTLEKTGAANLDFEDYMKIIFSEKYLKPRDVSILSLRFGLNGEKAHTLQESGEILNLTRERVRQIEQKALKKLRRRLKNKKELLSLLR